MRNRINVLKYQKELNRPLVLDGAIGSLLQQRGAVIHKHLWSSFANIYAPEIVVKIHKEYIAAGADIITTNTFRTNPIAYNKGELKISNKEFVNAAVALAMEGIKDKRSEIIIAGSNPPAEDSYQEFRKISLEELERNHKSHIEYLWESGVDFILNETQSHFDEIKIICEFSYANRIPFVISLFITEEGKILTGEYFTEVFEFVEKFNPIAIGINCVSPEVFERTIKKVKPNFNWGFYLNCGSGNYSDAEIFEGVSPSEYLSIAKKYFDDNLFFVGSCCGSSPLHTKKIKDFIIEKNFD